MAKIDKIKKTTELNKKQIKKFEELSGYTYIGFNMGSYRFIKKVYLNGVCILTRLVNFGKLKDQDLFVQPFVDDFKRVTADSLSIKMIKIISEVFDEK